MPLLYSPNLCVQRQLNSHSIQSSPSNLRSFNLQIVRHRLVAMLRRDILRAHETPAGLCLEAGLQVGGTTRQHWLPLLVAAQVQVVAGGNYQRYAVRVQRISAALRIHIVGLHVGHHD